MNESTILLVEDEPTLREVVGLYLTRAGFKVTSAADGKEALRLMEQSLPDLLVLDLMLPEVDGFEITSWLRNRSELPIIMITARRDITDRIAGLEMGADDYVVKPFSPQELVSRVRAVLRRTSGRFAQPRQRPIEYDQFSIDPNGRVVSIDGQEISLTMTEFDLLWTLASHPRQVFNRDQLLDQVWGKADYIDPSTITVHIRRLRGKLETSPGTPQYIKTVWGVGYKFEP